MNEETKVEEWGAVPTLWYKKVIALFSKIIRKGLSRLFRVSITYGSSLLTEFLNDKLNQRSAQLCVCEAMRQALRGEEAWKVAIAEAKKKVWWIGEKKVSGIEVEQNFLDCLLQLIYSCMKEAIQQKEGEETSKDVKG